MPNSSNSSMCNSNSNGKVVDGRIVVIGAGVAGVAMASALQTAGLDFVVYERNAGVGGLWFQNYPGASGTSKRTRERERVSLLCRSNE
jgi:cation diffusion facilitator CzcD-associated flavoprotein CzcO